MGFQEEIKSIKRNLKQKIGSLNPAKVKTYELKQKAEQEIALLKKDEIQLAKDKATEMVAINKQLNQHRTDEYQLKALFQIELNEILFEFNQKVISTNRLTQNESLLKYNNEVIIEKQKLTNKLIGLRDYAALDEKTIKERMDLLTSGSNEYLVKLKSIYDPQIEADKKKVITKKQVKDLVAEYTKEKNKKVELIKRDLSAKLAQITPPNKSIFSANKVKLEKKYQTQLLSIKSKINTIKADLKVSLANLPINSKFSLNDSSIKEKTAQFRFEANEKIKELKSQLDEARRVNSSNDTLKESQKMQMIFQDPISSLNPRMTVREIVGEGLIIQKRLSKTEIDKKVEDTLILVGLSPEYASRYPHEFSGGQRQRIGVARALIMNPNVIIADEPISALDVSIRAQIINLLFNLREKLGLTILFIAHDLSVVRFFCDRIAVMFNGKVVELASSEELFKNPIHPYTVSLLSAIPQPDPDYEKNRERIHYNPRQHDYRTDLPSLKEISPNHFVYLNNAEFAALQSQHQNQSKEK
jgi:oligopeptide transport system ATP-binding protein